MENRKIRDFGKAEEDTMDSISNDGSTSHPLTKIKDSNSAPDVSGTTANIADCTAMLPKQQAADAALGEQQRRQYDEQDGATRQAAGGPGASDNGETQEQTKYKGCDKCGKKFGLTGGFPCRCGGTFCAFHRYSDRHACNFDYREMGASQIRRDNPLVVPEKLRKL